ncbi:hypothetical protein JCM9279_002785 [Rhodotorula babjevae]
MPRRAVEAPLEPSAQVVHAPSTASTGPDTTNPPRPRSPTDPLADSSATASSSAGPTPGPPSFSSPHALSTESSAPVEAPQLAPSTSLDLPTTSPSPPEPRVCRICFGEEDEDDDLGRLLAPCLCRGTARYVHQDCLRSWREADKLNSFYQCGQCGARYRFRQTAVTRLLIGRHAVRRLTWLLLFVSAILAGFLADPLMRLADADSLILDSKTNKLQLRRHIFDEHLVAADGIREAVSTAGYLLGDCIWASPRELTQRERVTGMFWAEDGGGSEQAEEVWATTFARESRTRCAERWGRERDDEVRAGPVLGTVLHVVKGLATLSWLYIAGARLLRQWILFAITMRVYWARMGERLPFPYFNGLRSLGCSFLGDGAKWGRLGTKKLRWRGEITNWGQLTLHAICLLALACCYDCARDVVRALRKRLLLRVEDLVLDREAADGQATYERDGPPPRAPRVVVWHF